MDVDEEEGTGSGAGDGVANVGTEHDDGHGEGDGDLDEEVDGVLEDAVEGMSSNDAQAYTARYKTVLDQLNTAVEDQLSGASADGAPATATSGVAMTVSSRAVQRGEVPVKGSCHLMRSNATLRAALGTPFTALTEVALYHVLAAEYVGPIRDRVACITAKFNDLVVPLRARGLDVFLKSEHHVRNVEKLIDVITARYTGSVDALAAIGQNLTEFESTVGQPTAGYNAPHVITARTVPARSASAASTSNDRVDNVTDVEPGTEPMELTAQPPIIAGSGRRSGARTTTTTVHPPPAVRRTTKRPAVEIGGDEVCSGCNARLTLIDRSRTGTNAALFGPQSTEGPKAYHYLSKKGGGRKVYCPFDLDVEMPVRSWGPEAYRKYHTEMRKRSRTVKP
jgi:hypothetical protein